ncbi:hypothetical protein B0H13DRAFT_1914096 [Mycena leptocephala]|nr:hypothetical protein B0H13DRAFT_1914096 [Mycena leptocephala]
MLTIHPEPSWTRSPPPASAFVHRVRLLARLARAWLLVWTQQVRKGRAEKVWGDRQVFLLLGIRLGLEGVNPIYYEARKLLYTFPQSVGIAGGRPSSSYYFVGVQGEGLFYLDPHHSRPAVPLRPFAGEQPSVHRPLSSQGHGHSPWPRGGVRARPLDEPRVRARTQLRARGITEPGAGVPPRGIHDPDFAQGRGQTPMMEGELVVVRPYSRVASSSTSHDGSGSRHGQERHEGAGAARGLMTPVEESYYARAYSAAEMRTFHCERLLRTIFTIQDEDDDDEMGFQSISDPEELEDAATCRLHRTHHGLMPPMAMQSPAPPTPQRHPSLTRTLTTIPIPPHTPPPRAAARHAARSTRRKTPLRPLCLSLARASTSVAPPPAPAGKEKGTVGSAHGSGHSQASSPPLPPPTKKEAVAVPSIGGTHEGLGRPVAGGDMRPGAYMRIAFLGKPTFVAFSTTSASGTRLVAESARERRSGLCGGDSCMVWALQPEGFWRLGGPFFSFLFRDEKGGWGAWIFGEDPLGVWGLCSPALFSRSAAFGALICPRGEKGGWEFWFAFLFAFLRVGLRGSELDTSLAILADNKDAPLPFEQLIMKLNVGLLERMKTVEHFSAWFTKLECAGLRPYYFELNTLDMNNRRAEPTIAYAVIHKQMFPHEQPLRTSFIQRYCRNGAHLASFRKKLMWMNTSSSRHYPLPDTGARMSTTAESPKCAYQSFLANENYRCRAFALLEFKIPDNS